MYGIKGISFIYIYIYILLFTKYNKDLIYLNIRLNCSNIETFWILHERYIYIYITFEQFTLWLDELNISKAD